jgi:hypothetical protein
MVNDNNMLLVNQQEWSEHLPHIPYNGVWLHLARTMGAARIFANRELKHNNLKASHAHACKNPCRTPGQS